MAITNDNFDGVRLATADLGKANFAGANLRGVDLHNLDLRGVSREALIAAGAKIR